MTYLKLQLLPCQVKVIEEVTGKPFRPRLCCPDCYGDKFKKVNGRTECASCDSPYPPVMVSRAPEPSGVA